MATATATSTLPRLLSLTEAAEKLDCHPETLREWCRRGRGPAVIRMGQGKKNMQGVPLKFTEEALAAFLAARTITPAVDGE